jgi:spore germination protein GerM
MFKVRRALTLVVALALMTVVAAPGAVAQDLPPGGTFVDDDGNFHEASIEAIFAAGITQGCDVDRFCPDAPVTRGEMASFLARGLDGLVPATSDWFDDDASSVHQGDINIVAQNGIALGYGNRLFGPNDPVTRGQMASFLARGLDDLVPATSDWFDDDDGSIHEADINLIAHNGVTQGYADGTFRPAALISRAEMATMLTRALDLTPIQPPPRQVEVSAYFMMSSIAGDGSGPFLVPVARDITTPAAPATPTVEWLLAGPTQGEMDGIPSIMTAIPAGTELLGLSVANGVATVDLSSEFASGGGSLSMLSRVAQVVYTLTQFPTVDEVAFEIEGVPTTVLGGEGLMLDFYGTREGFLGTGLLPAVYVDSPVWSGEADNPMRIVGRTFVAGGEFVLAIVDNDGLILTEQTVVASGAEFMAPGGPLWVSFDVTVAYTVDTAQLGALIVWSEDPSDGSQANILEYPVRLIPAG